MFDLETLSVLIFFAVVAIFLVIDRKNLEFNYGFIIKKWTKGKKRIDGFVGKHQKILIKIGDLAIVFGIAAGLVGFGLLISYSFKLKQAYSLVLPTVGGYQIPGPVFSVPFWFWLIAIFTVVTFHEPMHAVFSRLAKVQVKDYGILLLTVLPVGAFVDPDMKQVEKLGFKKKMRIFASGSFGNFIAAILFIVIYFLSTHTTSLFIKSSGISFESTIPGTPASELSLAGTIKKINNTEINSYSDLVNFLNQVKPGETLRISTTKGIFVLKTIRHPDHPELPFIGIANTTVAYEYKPFFDGPVKKSVISSIATWYNLLMWIVIINLGVGVANMLPLKPLDGGYIFEEIFNKFLGKRKKIAINILSLITVSLILFNLFGIGAIKSFIL